MKPGLDEETLLARARCFDRDALAIIYDTYSSGVYRYAMRQLGDEDLAEECVAETFNRFLKALKSGGGPKSHLRAYLFRVAHNWIADSFRHSPPPEIEHEEPNDPDPDAESSITHSDPLLRKQIRAALLRLTEDQRQVILLKYIEGWSNEEIAQSLKKPVGAVKALQHRALNSLRKLLIPLENTG